MVSGPITFSQKAVGNLTRKGLLPGGASMASPRRSLRWLGEPCVSFLDNDNTKMFPNKEPQSEGNSVFGKHCVCIRAMLRRGYITLVRLCGSQFMKGSLK